MKMLFLLFFILLFSEPILAQNGFQFEKSKSKASLSFKLVNNLIIIPLKVNGVTLNFLLDTGVAETLIFSLDESNGISFTETQSIVMKGFGNKADFVAYKCKNNTISFGKYADNNHSIYLVLDQDINISSQVGITVNGIIGYHFFKNNLIKINYSSKKITVIKSSTKRIKNIEKEYAKIPFELDSNKPYILCFTNFEGQINSIPSKLLIDTGNSDALWLFKERDARIILSKKFINDYLGRGLNGDIYGQRSRVKSLQILNFKIDNPIAAFPDSLHTNTVVLSENRVGSVGSEIIKRFNVIFDYESNVLYLKKNDLFADSFEFNKSGIELQHQGLQWAMESFELNPALNQVVFDKNGDRIQNNLHFKFELKPIFVITHIREDSPAKQVGLLKDDVLVTVNGESAGNFKLQEITDFFKGDENKTITLQVDRKGVVLKFKFQLKSIL